MKKNTALFSLAAAAFLLPASLFADDDFQRERGKANDAAKDSIEGKAPPALEVTDWMNTEDEGGLKLTDLVGKVVIIDFWGTW